MARTPQGVVIGDDKVARCFWGASTPDYATYHDTEWGYPVVDDHRLFEKICLEGFQSGLSWLTILRKREGFRAAFAGFDYERIARFRKGKVDKLLQNAAIVRHRGKIESVLNNAARAREMADEFGGLAPFFWQFEPPKAERPRKLTKAALMKLAKTETSTRLSKELKRLGWSFVGPTTAYAFMQAMGLVNDHIDGCAARQRVAKARARFKPPRV